MRSFQPVFVASVFHRCAVTAASGGVSGGRNFALPLVTRWNTEDPARQSNPQLG